MSMQQDVCSAFRSYFYRRKAAMPRQVTVEGGVSFQAILFCPARRAALRWRPCSSTFGQAGGLYEKAAKIEKTLEKGLHPLYGIAFCAGCVAA